MNKSVKVILLSIFVLFYCIGDVQAFDCENSNKIKHVVVYEEAGKFCGWPANEGIWSWGDEILVGFEISGYMKNDKGHSIDRESPKHIYFARSLDGGESWDVEKPKEILPPAYMESLNEFRKEKVLNKKLNFSNPDFVMKLRYNRFYYSYDRGKTWKGPYGIPDFNQKLLAARTDYLLINENEAMTFFAASDFVADGTHAKVMAAKITNGNDGLCWNSIGWVQANGFPKREYKRFSRSTMPSTVFTSEKKLLCALRQRDDKHAWLDVYASDDMGKTWVFGSQIADNLNNPPSLLVLKDGRIVVTYCRRQKPYGLRAKISEDDGKTWSHEKILRGDGLSWDIGYVQSMQRQDGKVVSVYYYHTQDHPEQRIEATIWNP